MSKIIGVTVGTPLSVSTIKEKLKPVTSVNGVEADANGNVVVDVSGQINTHNTATDAHNDIRLLVTELANRLNALANSTDVDLDQMAELVSYIKDNRELIEQITTNKVSVSDIINNLTTNVSNKPLSAAQGVALKSLIDSLSTGKLDVTAIADWAKAATKPSYSKSDVGLGNVDNVRQYSANNPPPYPVTSVNGMTGDVVLEAGGGGGTSIVVSETDPGNLVEGDFWYKVMTELEPPKEMFPPYIVTLPSGAGYTVSGGDTTVYRGDSYSFTVTIADGYEAGSGFAVKANGVALSAVNGVYTITNIMENQTVTVEGVEASVALVNITGTGNTTYCYATINGQKRYGAASNIEVKPGSVITFGVYGRSTTYRGTLTIDGSQVLNVTNQQTQTYNWTVPAGTKTISINMAYTSTSTQRRGTITVTTTK